MDADSLLSPPSRRAPQTRPSRTAVGPLSDFIRHVTGAYGDPLPDKDDLPTNGSSSSLASRAAHTSRRHTPTPSTHSSGRSSTPTSRYSRAIHSSSDPVHHLHPSSASRRPRARAGSRPARATSTDDEDHFRATDSENDAPAHRRKQGRQTGIPLAGAGSRPARHASLHDEDSESDSGSDGGVLLQGAGGSRRVPHSSSATRGTR